MNILFPELLRFSDAGLPLLRLMVACVFFTSGLNHLKAPAERAKGIGLILIMLGAIQKKIFVWKTGFWGKGGSGWHYDLMLLVMNLVIVVTGGGKLVSFA